MIMKRQKGIKAARQKEVRSRKYEFREVAISSAV
jgi:hypothetical protein